MFIIPVIIPNVRLIERNQCFPPTIGTKISDTEGEFPQNFKTTSDFLSARK